MSEADTGESGEEGIAAVCCNRVRELASITSNITTFYVQMIEVAQYTFYHQK